MPARKPMIDESGEVRELTAADVKTFKRGGAALPASLRAKTGVRGPQKAPTKIPLSLRLSPQVVEAFRASAVVGKPIGHVLILNAHFLASGLPVLLGGHRVDPTPRPIPPLAKAAVVFASLPLHAFFAIILMSMQKVLGESFYRSLHLKLTHRPNG